MSPGHVASLKGVGWAGARGFGLARAVAWLLVGGVTGWFAWGQGDSLDRLTVLLLLPVGMGFVRSRGEALVLMFGYFAAGARGLPGGAVVFFGDSAPAWWGSAMWAAASLSLSAPFAVLWRADLSRRAVGFGIATLACVAPPLGVVGWLNPLSVAGLLFPSWGWAGLAMTLMTFTALASRRIAAIIVCGLATILANLGETPAVAPPGWLGFDTNFARLSSAGADQASQWLAALRRIEWVKRAAADMPAGATLVLPETLLGRYDGVAQGMLAGTDAELQTKRSRVLVGAELPLSDGRYQNALIVLGAQPGDGREAIQGIPVPISMWKPWADDGARADLLARNSVIVVGQLRTAVAVCYEQLLTYSLLMLIAKAPDIIVASSNVWWAKATSIPTIQRQSVQSYARLFHVPAVFARNI